MFRISGIWLLTPFLGKCFKVADKIYLDEYIPLAKNQVTMAIQIQVIPHLLSFNFDARTSRGTMRQHQVYYLKLGENENAPYWGLGECAPLAGLSSNSR